MKYYGKIQDNKDLVTKEYVDGHAGGGNVDDVKINGTSVVTNKIANITVEDNLTSTSTSNSLSANLGKVLKDTIDTIKTLRPMKAAWTAPDPNTGEYPSTSEVASRMRSDSDVHEGDGYLGSFYRIKDMPFSGNAEVKAFVIINGIIQFEMTSSNVSPYAWFYNSAGGGWRSYVPINNTTSSTSTTEVLSANMGKELQDQVNNLKNIGRFLSIWNASTGAPTSEPTLTTYSYKVGDYYRVGTAGTKNPAPNSTYIVGGTNWVEGGSLSVGDVIYCSNINESTSTWVKQAASGGGTVQDVQINGDSIVASGTGIANIPHASVSNSGVIKTGASFNTNVLSSGYMQAVTNTYSQYQSKGVDAFIGKGTLENVLDNETVRVDKAQTLTDTQKTQATSNIGTKTIDSTNDWSTYTGNSELVFVYE